MFLRLAGVLRRFLSLSHDKLAILVAVVAGIASGVSAYLFTQLLHFAHEISYGRFVDLPLSRRWIIAIFPAIGGVLTGLITRYVSRDARGQGVGEVIFAIRKNRSRITGSAVVGKALASAATIGTGGSGGPEGPIIQIGGGVGSILGRLVGLPPNLLRVMVAAGAAGGISAILNAPIAGVLFAMEVILKDFVVNAFSLVVISSVSGAVVSHILVGDMTFLRTPPFEMAHNWELLLCAGLGLLTAAGATLFSKLMLTMERMFEQMDPVGEVWLPAVGGIGIGLVGVFLPPVLGEGIEFMTRMVRGEPIYLSLAIGAFLLLTIAKIIGTGLSLGSGGSGGLLMPCFFCGGTLGAVFGITAGHVFPSISNYGPYALLGTAAFFAAVSRAPFTAIILLFELTHDGRVILPGMVACVSAALAARNIAPLSYEALRLSRKGLSPTELESKDTLVHLHVDSTMVRNVVTLRETMTFAELRQIIEQTRHTGYPVVDDRGLLVGLVADGDLYSAVSRGGDPNELRVRDIMRRVYGTVTPDVTLRKAVEVMNEYGQDRVPVVDEMNPQHVVGLVSRSQIMAAFQSLSH